MSNASSARQLGDEVHRSIFWHKICRMTARGKIAKVGFETEEFKAFDDVAVVYATPKSNGAGGWYDEDHSQVKFSMTGEKTLTDESLTDPKFINATSVSLLERLQQAVVKAEAENRRCLFRLWSPWSIEPGSVLAAIVDKTDGSLRIKQLLAGRTVGSRTGKVRKIWADCLGIDMNDATEFRRILTPLRIEQDVRTYERIRDDLSMELATAGYRPIDECQRSDSYSTLIQKLSAEGVIWFDRDCSIKYCMSENLWIGTPANQDTDAKHLGIRSYTRFADTLEDHVDEILCVSQFFDDRWIAETSLWSGEVLPRLSTFLSEQLKSGQEYRFSLATHGSVAFAAGYFAEPKLGARFAIEQRGPRGTQLWKPNDSIQDDRPHGLSEKLIEIRTEGEELALAVSISQPLAQDVESFVRAELPGVRQLLHCAVEKTGQDVLLDGQHAFDCARQIIGLITSLRNELGVTGRIHLFWAAPNAFVFFLGQLSRGLGVVNLYEFDFERTHGGSYSPSLVLSPDMRLN